MNTLKKYWPSLAHVLAVVVIAANPSVQAQAVSHPGYSAIIGAVWGFLLHWAQSPSQKPPA
jgi:hypothetical protein